tara:strand:+ start:3671 stop:4621 length:951 start_codon:yes stop_codon:yes gene_type:complete
MRKMWESVCLIGLGNHAKTKILPALIKNFDKDKISIVTRKKIDRNLNINYFKTLEESYKENNKNSLYYLATPPSLHYPQTKNILNNGFDVMVEKPSFISLEELNEINEICNQKNLLMIEAKMYLENKICKILSEFLQNNLDNITKIETNFTIPQIPKGTFRTEKNLSTSLLADIGCYPLSFLAANSINLSNLKIPSFERKESRIIYNLFLKYKNFSFYSKIGLSNNYENNIKISLANNKSIEVNPFYYGRETEIKIKSISESRCEDKTILENNAYEILLSRSRNYWESQKYIHFYRLKNVVKTLQRIAFEIDMDLK